MTFKELAMKARENILQKNKLKTINDNRFQSELLPVFSITCMHKFTSFFFLYLCHQSSVNRIFQESEKRTSLDTL